jgi:hypothetical protein
MPSPRRHYPGADDPPEFNTIQHFSTLFDGAKNVVFHGSHAPRAAFFSFFSMHLANPTRAPLHARQVH